jgi:hypothetical protein
MTTRTATLDRPTLLPTSKGYIVVADDAGGPFPRIGDVERDGRRWLAWPMGAERKVTCFSRREAVAFIVATARQGHSPKTPDVGDRVAALFPNTKWGRGEVVEVRTDPKMKRYVVRRDDGTIGNFHDSQVVVIDQPEEG